MAGPPDRPFRMLLSGGPLAVVLVLVLSLLLPAPVQALSEPYQKLKEQLEAGAEVDSGLVESLPEPSGPTEYYLRSRTRDRTEEALRDLDRALRKGPSTNEKIVVSWLELALLEEPSRRRLNRLKELMNRSSGDFSGTVWLLGAKYAGYLGEYERAHEWGQPALKDRSTRREALLDLAEYALKRERLDRSRDYLDRYFLEYPEVDRSRHWNTRGRLLTELGSDSEAYLAFSHVVRNYPNSLELDEAERRLSELSLPEPFRPDQGSPRPRTETDKREGTKEDSAQPGSQGGWKIQLGSFRDRDRAKVFKDRMESRLEKSLVITRARVDGTRYYRVQIPSFGSKYEAEQQKDKLHELGIDAFILDG